MKEGSVIDLVNSAVSGQSEFFFGVIFYKNTVFLILNDFKWKFHKPSGNIMSRAELEKALIQAKQNEKIDLSSSSPNELDLDSSLLRKGF